MPLTKDQKDAIKIFNDASKLLKRPGGWTFGRLARRRGDERPKQSAPVAYCALGAMAKAAGVPDDVLEQRFDTHDGKFPYLRRFADKPEALASAYDAARKCVETLSPNSGWGYPVADYNDSALSPLPILKLFECAIDYIERQSKPAPKAKKKK